MNNQPHWGDLDYEDHGDFCTFYMTCICGWKSELRMINNSVDSYYFQEKWRKHNQSDLEFQRNPLNQR